MSSPVKARRARRTKGHESISRDMLQEKALTVKARGILAILQSLPDEWDVNGVQGFVDQFCGRDGYHAINEGIKELEAFGYFARLKRQGEGGKWLWLWSYSHDPADVDAAVAEWESLGYKVATTRGGNRGAVTPAEREKGVTRSPRTVKKAEPAGRTALENPQHGAEPVSENPGHGPSDSVLGKPVDGSSVDGEPPNKEIHSRDIPPTPPQAGGTESSLDEPPAATTGKACEPHGRVNCRPCGLSPRVQARVERERVEAEAAAAEEAGRRCPVCTATGLDGEGRTVWSVAVPGTQVPESPRTTCRHDRSYAEVMAEVREAEEARERAAAERSVPAGPVSSPESRARARALYQSRQRPEDKPAPLRAERARTVHESAPVDGVAGSPNERLSA